MEERWRLGRNLWRSIPVPHTHSCHTRPHARTHTLTLRNPPLLSLGVASLTRKSIELKAGEITRGLKEINEAVAGGEEAGLDAGLVAAMSETAEEIGDAVADLNTRMAAMDDAWQGLPAYFGEVRDVWECQGGGARGGG